MPRLKNRACTENLGESGSNRTANGSSNDSSISLGVKELFISTGVFFQSNSIAGSIVYQTPMQCIYFVFTHGVFLRQELFSINHKKSGRRERRRPANSNLESALFFAFLTFAAGLIHFVHQDDQW